MSAVWPKLGMFPVAWLTVAVALAACAPSPTPPAFPAGDPAHPIKLAVSPVAGLSSADGTDLVTRLQQSTGISFKVAPSSSSSAVADLGSGAAHIAWLDPLGYAVARKRYGADVGLVAVRRGSDHFSSQIIANARAGLKGPEALRGRAFCFAAAASTENYAIPRIILQANGVDPAKNLRVSKLDSDERIVAAVYEGNDCVAGAIVGDARAAAQNQFPEAMDKIVVLEASPNIPNDAIVFAKGFPADLRGRITDALEGLTRTTDGRHLLHVEGLVRKEDSAYDRLRDLLTQAAADPANYLQ